tara:strand:+ start:268 stop:708 length:441 start_codon:yes stop_codon:yes gene_type:complete
MEISELTLTLLEAKKKKELSFADLGKLIDRDEVWVAALLYLQATASDDEAAALGAALSLEKDLYNKLTVYPTKGLGPVVPTDPFTYRFYEILQVYGMPMKSVIQEKFGDGIMSAIDFTLNIDKAQDPQGDRVIVTMNGKFLPYKKW